MIIQITRGDDPLGLVDYLLGKTGNLREGARLVGLEGLASLETAPLEMRKTFLQSERCKSPILHVSIALDPGETLGPDEWQKVWQDVAKLLQMEHHQRIVVAHDEKGHQHQHGAFNIIHPDTGRTPAKRFWSPRERQFLDRGGAAEEGAVMRSWDTHLKYRLQALSRKLEQMLGLANANAPEKWASRKREKGIPTANAIAREARVGVVPLIEIAAPMKKALRKPTWAERIADLAVIGVGARLYDGKNKKRHGLVLYAIEDPANAIAASSLGSDYGLTRLEREAGQTFADYHGGRLHGDTPRSTAREPRREDPLWEAFRDYQRVVIKAQEQWQVHYDSIIAMQRKEKAGKLRLQGLEKSRHLRSTARHNKLMMRHAIEASQSQEREIWRIEDAAIRKEARTLRPAATTWKLWLDQQAQTGNETAAQRLVQMERRGLGQQPVSSKKMLTRKRLARAADLREEYMEGWNKIRRIDGGIEHSGTKAPDKLSTLSNPALQQQLWNRFGPGR